jgi:UPF0755 protein
MKKLLLFLIIIASIIFFVFFWWQSVNKPLDPLKDKPQRFVITRGMTVSEIGTKLAKEGLIKSPFAFKLYVQFLGKTQDIKAGEFQLSPSEKMSEIVSKLMKGPDLVWITFPEGLRREEIAIKIIKEIGVKDAQEFYSQFILASEGKEGFLFPDTYLVPKEITAQKMVDILYDNFNKKTNILISDINKTKMSLLEIVVLASLIERETNTESERPIVAGILLKRLENDWPLQVDASVQYAIGSANCREFKLDCKWWPILSKEDLNVESPFNSYKFRGLPPKPIANPGISSIKAVIFPEATDYWFYIHDTNGKIRFAKTLEEHQGNIRKYLVK